MEKDMKKVFMAAVAGSLLTIPAFAQESQLHAEVENTLRSKGAEIEVPDDLTNAQLARLLGIANREDLDANQMEAEVENVLGQ
jgi:hypothetical protein